MTPSEIQAFRKRRLQEAIDKFFGSKVALAKKLKNKDGQPLKDGSYVGQLLKPEGHPSARPIDEDRVREIECLHPSLRGWFNHPDDANRSMGRSISSIQSFTGHPSSDTTSPRAPVVEWARLGMDLLKDNTEFRSAETLPTPSNASPTCKWVKVESDHPRLRIMKGDLVALEPVEPDDQLRSGKVYLFQAADGALFLAEYRPLAAGNIEAIPDTGLPMDRDRHGIKVLARKRGTWE